MFQRWDRKLRISSKRKRIKCGSDKMNINSMVNNTFSSSELYSSESSYYNSSQALNLLNQSTNLISVKVLYLVKNKLNYPDVELVCGRTSYIISWCAAEISAHTAVINSNYSRCSSDAKTEYIKTWRGFIALPEIWRTYVTKCWYPLIRHKGFNILCLSGL